MSLIRTAQDVLSSSALVAITEMVSPTSASHPFWVMEWDQMYHPEVIWCSLILFFSAVLCSAAGIGGGGIYVAVLMVTGKLTPYNAVPLSKAIVFFGAVASLFVNVYKSVRGNGQGEVKKSCIDTDACRLVVPATLIGTFLGVLLNRHTSDYIIVLLLTSILAMMTGMVSRTARQQAMEEHAQDEAAQVASTITNDAGSTDDQAGENTPLINQDKAVAPAAPVQNMIPKSRTGLPTRSDALMGGALLFLVISGGVFRFHMNACHAEVLGDTTKTGACEHPVNMVFNHHMRTWMGNTSIASVLQKLVWFLPMWSCIFGTVHFGIACNREVGWRPSSVVTYQIVSIATGLLAGLVGIGGGLILSPFFLLTGMDPVTAVQTSSTCVLFTSSSTTMQYIFTDRIIMSLALVYGVVCCVASSLGTWLVHYIQERWSRKSYITTIVAVSVAISAMLSVVKFVYLVANVNKGAEVQAH